MSDPRAPGAVRETAAEIEAEATRWVMRVDRDGPSAHLTEALDAWLAEDSRRRGAWLQAQAAFHLATHAGTTAADQPLPAAIPAPAPFTRRAALFGGVSAAIAASIAGVVLWWPWERYSTAIGEVRRVPLADGSIAQINTASKVAVLLERKQRTIVLDEGEAWFQVAHDKARPFIVEAGHIRVQAVGTAFSVRRRDGGADILVTEGVVEAWADGARGALVRISAGERAFVADNAATQVAPPAHDTVDRALAWRDGRIDLAGEPLGQAVAEFNRYNDRKILLADPALAGERFYGVFRTTDPEGFAQAIHQSLGAAVTVDDRQIRIGG